MKTTSVRATGIPNGYVERVHELGNNGKRVRAAMTSGLMAKPVRNRRSQLSKSEAREEALQIKSALNGA